VGREGEKTIGVKAFQFRLKSVLEIRTRDLEEAQQHFATQQQCVVELKQRLDENHQQFQLQLQPDLEKNVDPIFSQQRFRYLQYLKQQAQYLTQEIIGAEKILETLREKMKQAHIKKRSLELLEEKQRKNYITMIENQEMKEIEDIVVARFHRS
jgi:flagellar export protein FliJ